MVICMFINLVNRYLYFGVIEWQFLSADVEVVGCDTYEIHN